MSERPSPDKRKFTSDVIEKKIMEVKGKLKDKEIARLFENCFPNTLDTTVIFSYKDNEPDTFVITGDIKAMWLRDSTAQVFPYLKFANKDNKLKELIKGVINRQKKCILVDSYANAFNNGPTGEGWQKDNTKMMPEVYERKWEIDSLCYPIRLAYFYWKNTQDISIFNRTWVDSIQKIIDTFIEQQRKSGKGSYKFTRETSWQTDTVAGGGYGNPVIPVGLIVSIFRPSDDATIFPFLIPSNLFAVRCLKYVSEISVEVLNNNKLSNLCISLADEIENSIYKYAVSEKTGFGKIYAYEVDGYGNKYFMDDANVPNLLSLRYLDCCSADDEIYRNTRNFVLSENNPYFFKGPYGEGLGSPHTLADKIWPIGIIMRAMTSYDDNEIMDCIETLKNTHDKKYFMHESFFKNDPSDFTRSWFAWANTLFGELILKLLDERPYLVT